MAFSPTLGNDASVTPRRLATVLLSTGLTLTGGASAVAASTPCPPSKYRSSRTLIIAHASGNYFGPPNTVEMMKAAIAAGADILDTDVLRTKDGVLVAAHDDVVRVNKTATMSISKSTFADLEKVDLGETWSGPSGTYPLAGKHVKVPSLETVLTTFPRYRVGIEFKTDGDEGAMCTLLRKLKRTDTVFVSSGGDGPVNRFKSLCPEAVTTVTDAMESEYLNAQATGAAWCAPVAIGQPPLGFRDFHLTKEDVTWDHAHGLADYTWVADTKASVRAVGALGVDAVYTGRADLAKAILKR